MSNELPITPVILVVDDDPRALQLVGKLLSDALACDLCFATSGGEALEIMESVTPDLVLLDVNMPGMNGYEVCMSIRAKEEYGEIPVIFLTVQRDPEHVVRGFEAGGTDYVGKPFESRELLARVRVQLELKLSHDKLVRQKEELEAAIARIRHLEGIIPICMYCKKVRTEEDSWKKLEIYVSEHSEALFSHGICPECREKIEKKFLPSNSVNYNLPASAQEVFHPPEVDNKIVQGAHKILIMDDDEGILDIVREILLAAGYDVLLARDGREMLEVYEKALSSGAPFDAVILDLTISGGMGGKEAVGHLLQLDPQAKAIVSSGYSNDPVMADFESFGFRGAVSKPFRFEDLCRVLEDVLR